jgi:energy-coupling factor transporter ATP-binding protein EcfA2
MSVTLPSAHAGPGTDPPPTEFELKFSAAADAVIAEHKTGYQWGPVDELLQSELSEELGPNGTTRCKQAKGSGRAANVLTESNDKNIDLYLVFIHTPYTVAQFLRAAENRIGRFPNVRTVAVAAKHGGVWRVESIIEREGVGLAERIRSHFPLVQEGGVHLVKGPAITELEVPELERPDEEVFASAIASRPTLLDKLNLLANELLKLAQESGVSLDATVATDLLSCALSAQMLLFAGPSGTGKSTLARLLARFLTTDEMCGILNAKRGWGSPEDAVGYYSPLSEQFAQTSDTSVLTDLHEACADAVLKKGDSADSAPVPVLIVEEANLSVIEGYLAPVVHGLSSPSVPYLRWPLHAQREGALDTDDALNLPPTLLFGPWPRVFGTINVDANSAAPAHKVTARTAVVLLEPASFIDVDKEATRLALPRPDSLPSGSQAVPYAGDPESARLKCQPERLRELIQALATLLTNAGGDKALVPSIRDLYRSANYMAYYDLLTGQDTDPAVISRRAAENAILHFVLPQLSAEDFSRVLRNLTATVLEPPSTDADVAGGLLAPRIERLAASLEGALFSDTVDFWAALS